MPEVAHSIALGAYVEDFWALEPYDVTDKGEAAWAASDHSLVVETRGVPAETILVSGPAILQIQLSGLIDEAQIRRFVPVASEIANVTIVPRDQTPRPGLVLSAADAAHVRGVVREAVAGLTRHRPNLTILHLFVSGPPSVAVGIGQEIRLRAGVRAQTYRHRPGPSGAAELSEAILLAAQGPERRQIPLTPEQEAFAAAQRATTWIPAIESVQRYAERKARVAAQVRPSASRRWYDGILLGEELRRVRPFPALPPVEAIVEGPAHLDPEPFDRGFGFERSTKRWRIDDHLVVGIGDRFPVRADALALARIFLFHEYLHVVHGITKPTAAEVGKFANSLEHADYMCDLFGILHELDLEGEEAGADFRLFSAVQRRVVQLIDLVVRSYWAFEESPERTRMEYRRIRRYMNWYWQLTRVAHARSLVQIAAILARKPVVEIAGLESRAEGRRHYASLERLDSGAAYEMCIVLDNERLHRISSGPTASLMELLGAFRHSHHEALVKLFTQLFEHVGAEQALPDERSLFDER